MAQLTREQRLIMSQLAGCVNAAIRLAECVDVVAYDAQSVCILRNQLAEAYATCEPLLYRAMREYEREQKHKLSKQK